MITNIKRYWWDNFLSIILLSIIMINKILSDVFKKKPDERVTIVFDTPSDKDTQEWKQRRELAIAWHTKVDSKLFSYPSTGSNNADLPAFGFLDNKAIKTVSVMQKTDTVIALTQFSATAPLHAFAKRFNIRAVSMPGFNLEMMPALNIDFEDLKNKVNKIYDLLNWADSARVLFEINEEKYNLDLDLRHRKAGKDDADCSRPGTVINLPSGEAFIVPVESNLSKTKGFLPIQFNDKVCVYRIEQNKT